MDSQPLLDELLDFLNTVNRINRNLAQKESRSTLGSLSAIQLQALITMRRYGTLNMSELADFLLVTRPQLTKIIDVLVRMGLIARKANPESRRETLIELTEQGKHYLEDSVLSKSGLLARVLACSDQDEIEELRQAVRTMHKIFAKAMPD